MKFDRNKISICVKTSENSKIMKQKNVYLSVFGKYVISLMFKKMHVCLIIDFFKNVVNF